MTLEEDESFAGAVARAFLMGGPWMYGVLACGVLLLLSGALAARLKPLSLASSLVLAVLTMAVAAISFVFNLASLAPLIDRAWWADRNIILIGGTGEALWPVAFAALLIASAFLAQGVALAVASTSVTEPRPIRMLAAGVTVLGLWQLAVMRATLAEIDACTAVAHAAPSDRLSALINASPAVKNGQTLGLFVLAAVALMVVVALVQLRSTPRARAAVVAAILIPLAALGGLRALAQPSREQRALRTTNGLPRTLVRLPGRFAPEMRPFASVGQRYRNLDDVQEPLLHLIHGERAQFALEDGFSLQAVTDMFVTLRSMRMKRVTLSGVLAEETPVDTPEPLRATFMQETGFDVVLGPESCPEGGCALLTSEGLTWKGETFPLVATGGTTPDPDPSPIPFALDGQTSDSFLKAALAADSKSRQLLLVFPNPP